MHRLRQTTLTFVVVLITLESVISMAPASAHAAIDFYDGGVFTVDPGSPAWRGDVEIYNHSNISGAFLSRILDGVGAWDSLNRSLNFRRVGVNTRSLDCTQRPIGYSVFYMGLIDGAPTTGRDTFAETRRCLYSNNVLIGNFNIKFDSGNTWWTSTGTTVPVGRPDLWSVATHEFGHAAGWRRHIDEVNPAEGSTICANNSGQQTMCINHYTRYPDIAPISGTTRQRDPATHDIDTFTQVY